MGDVRQGIVKWLTSQPYWVQTAAEKILKKELINDEFIDQLLALLKTPPSQEKSHVVNFVGYFNNAPSTHDEIRITSIGEIEGIDNLGPKTPLSFAPTLSVVYGHNGSGKSGYARILKKICGKPNSPELLPNVYKAPPQSRKCTVTAKISGADHSFNWVANSAPVEELLSVDVFDSQTGVFYLDKEQEVSFVPNEVALFEQLVDVYKKLQDKLKIESLKISSKLPSKPAEFGSTKYLTAMYERLSHSAEPATVENFFKFSDEDEENLKRLNERLEQLPTDLANAKNKRVTQLKNLLLQINSALNKVSVDAVKELQQLKSVCHHKQKIAKEAAAAVANEAVFKSFGADTWKAMWEAARNYSVTKAYPEADFPFIGESAKCVLCEQDLNESTKLKLQKFEAFVTGELQTDADKALEAVTALISKLPNVASSDQLVTALQAAQLDQDIWLPIFSGAWQVVERISKDMQDLTLDNVEGIDSPQSLFSGIDTLILKLSEEIVQHELDAATFDVNTVRQQANELKSKKWASGYTEQILEEIRQLKIKHGIEEQLKLVATAPVSKEAGKVSEALITQAFIDRFNAELNALGASKIKVELVKTPPKLGKVPHKIQLHGLSTNYQKSKAISILSEGEQRIVALAAFLADVTGKPSKSPFIFDDPISSLDQSYEENTAKRLSDLSQDRQVIVFTHRLSLLGQLIELGDAECKHIRREPWGCGEHSSIPIYAKTPMRSVNDLKNDRLPKARKAYNEFGYEEYYPLAKAICSDFRILLERVVEVEFLADVVQRHRREIHTKNKMAKLAKINSDDCKLIEKLMTEFSKFEHSQTDDAPVEVPEPDDLAAYIDELITWYSTFKNRVC